MKNEENKILKSFEDLSNFISAEVEDVAEKEYIEKQEQREAFKEIFNPTYKIVSIVAYLIGVKKETFESSAEPPQLDTYEELNKNKDARIIRNLCLLRNAFERFYVAINKAFFNEGKNIGRIPEFIPPEIHQQLHKDNVDIFLTKPDATSYIIKINQEIINRIDSVASLFPDWVNWNYIKPLFIMPNGLKPEGVAAAGTLYNSDRNRYPYKCWLNWDAVSVGLDSKGNILYADEKFLKLIYEANEDIFENISFVRDVGNQTIRNLNNLLTDCHNCIIVVDCENSEPVKLAAAFSSLPKSQLDKISKVLLFDSEHTTSQWETFYNKSLGKILNPSTIPEHIIVQRLNENKSQVDLTLTIRTAKEVLSNNADAVILVSSDSDYWPLIKELPSAKFLLMLEKEKTGSAIIDTLLSNNVYFCFIDDFCIEASYEVKTDTLIDEMQRIIDSILAGDLPEQLNLYKIMENCLHSSWINMTEREKNAFIENHLRKPQLTVAKNGVVSISIK